MSRKRILLVVDDEPSIARLIIRNIRKNFDEVLFTSTQSDAESTLKSIPVTHLICDVDLGPTQRKGFELLPDWLGEYSTIKNALLFTGHDISEIPEIEGVEVLSKSCSPDELLAQLKQSAFGRMESSL